MASATSPIWRAFQDNEITHSGAHYLLAISALTIRPSPPRRGRGPAA